jgi:hypothetical protein
MIDFVGAGYEAMERLGLLAELAAIHEPIRRIVFLDATGRQQVTEPYSVVRERLFRGRHFNFQARLTLTVYLAPRSLRMDCRVPYTRSGCITPTARSLTPQSE